MPPGQGGGGGGLNKATPASIALKGPPRSGGDGISTDRHHVKDREREKAGDREAGNRKERDGDKDRPGKDRGRRRRR